jgi:transcriptional regulator with XRE-family HTH domain
MKRTIQQMREERGESRMQLADALQVTLDEVTDWELGQGTPGLSRVQALAEHFDVPDYELEIYPDADHAEAN